MSKHHQQPMQCLKVLTMSGWNPPPGNRKMHGDLMYLYMVTVEERHVSVTASTRGFYLNQSVNVLSSYFITAPCFLSTIKLHNLFIHSLSTKYLAVTLTQSDLQHSIVFTIRNAIK